jgi:hypothetical protein
MSFGWNNTSADIMCHYYDFYKLYVQSSAAIN